MRKSKQESIDELLPAYFAGRSESFKEKFYARDLEHQYMSIMAWRRRSKTPVVAPKEAGVVLLKDLKKVRRGLELGAELSELEIKKLGRELNLIREALSNYDEIRRQREIEDLEREYEKIAQRLNSLRENN